MINPFWNSLQRRLRAFWRLLILIAIAAAVANPLVILLDQTDDPLLESSFENAFIAIGFLVALFIGARFIDRRPIRDFGLRSSAGFWGEVGVGFLIGGAMIASVFLIQWLAGWTKIVDTKWSVSTAPFALAIFGQMVRYLAGSFFEEFVSRSYLLRLIAESLRGMLQNRGTVIAAWIGTSIFFGGLHGFNPGATFLSTFNLCLFGLVLGLPMVVTGSLALPIGLHMGWNVFQQNVFGMPNGGKVTKASFLLTEPTGPSLWTGDEFGPEGSLLSIGALVLGAFLVMLWLRRRGPIAIQGQLAEPPQEG